MRTTKRVESRECETGVTENKQRKSEIKRERESERMPMDVNESEVKDKERKKKGKGEWAAREMVLYSRSE